MKTGLTIKEMAQELLRQSKAKQDYLVNTGSLSLSVTSDAPQLRVTENGLDTVSYTHLDVYKRQHLPSKLSRSRAAGSRDPPWHTAGAGGSWGVQVRIRVPRQPRKS